VGSGQKGGAGQPRRLGYLGSSFLSERSSSRLAAAPRKRLRSFVLAVVGTEVLLLLAGEDAHHLDGVADHVGGALLAFRSARHQ
jgi:hypothetical protein